MQVRITNKAHAHSHWQRQVWREAHMYLREEAGRLLPKKPPRLAFINCSHGENMHLSPDGSEPQPFHTVSMADPPELIYKPINLQWKITVTKCRTLEVCVFMTSASSLWAHRWGKANTQQKTLLRMRGSHFCILKQDKLSVCVCVSLQKNIKKDISGHRLPHL